MNSPVVYRRKIHRIFQQKHTYRMIDMCPFQNSIFTQSSFDVFWPKCKSVLNATNFSTFQKCSLYFPVSVLNVSKQAHEIENEKYALTSKQINTHINIVPSMKTGHFFCPLLSSLSELQTQHFIQMIKLEMESKRTIRSVRSVFVAFKKCGCVFHVYIYSFCMNTELKNR